MVSLVTAATGFSPSVAFGAPKPVNDFPEKEKEGAAATVTVGALSATSTGFLSSVWSLVRAPKEGAEAGAEAPNVTPVPEAVGAGFDTGAPNENPVGVGTGAGTDGAAANEKPFGTGGGGAVFEPEPNKMPEEAAADEDPNENPADGLAAGVVSVTAGVEEGVEIFPKEMVDEGAGAEEPNVVAGAEGFLGAEPKEAPEDGPLDPNVNPEDTAAGVVLSTTG
jgi:hypothetical protein